MTSKILLFAEAVSLAHVVRPAVLAQRLQARGATVHFACANRFPAVHRAADWTLHLLQSVSPENFIRRLAKGQPVHNFQELVSAVQEDLALIDHVQPDLVVGDFRLSLSISARLAAVPYMAICNAHWSPWRVPLAAKMPAHPIGAVLGYTLPDLVFQAVWSGIAARHVAAPNAVRQRYRLPPLPSLEHWYCDGDSSAFVDTPRLVPPAPETPATCHYVGPVVWSPPMAEPGWWPDVVNSTGRFAYLSMGTTGHVGLVPMLLEACLTAGVQCMVSTAGRTNVPSRPPQVYCQDYLPGLDACACSALVICNGGSATVHQALSRGRPVLGVCSNLDQVRTMQYVEASGAGLLLRSNEATPARVASMVRRLLSDSSFSEVARQHAADFAQFWRCCIFERLVDQMVGQKSQLPVAPIPSFPDGGENVPFVPKL